MHDPESAARVPFSDPADPSPDDRSAELWRRTDFGQQVRDALLHLYDVPYLQIHPLTRWVQKEPGARTPGVGQSLRQELVSAIAGTRPDTAASSGSGRKAGAPSMVGAEPRGHRIMAARYVDGMAAREVQAQLGIGKSEYYREHQRGLDAVISLLAERWGHADHFVRLPGSRELHGTQSPMLPTLSPVLRRPERPPVPLTGLIGRQQELAAIKQILASARLVTLTGFPGTGKTRVALEIAADATDDFPDGVYFVPLAALADPALVIPTVAQAFGVPQSVERPLARSVAEAIGDRRILLVLDNFEQVAPAALELVEVLQGSPRLTALVTSRGRLHVRGERELPIAPLAVPPAGPLGGASELAGYAAVALFIERAREVRADFALTDDNAPAVAEICRRLDGLPLAIELAAARSKLLPPRALLDRLQPRLPLLTRGARDLPAWHQTLRDAIAWSYDLLDAAEQALFRRLAIFVGGCTLDAAEAVVGEGVSVSLLDGLGSLIDASLLRRGEQREGEPRFLMLETVREYGLEQLTAAGEVEVLRRRHADLFTELAEENESTVDPSNPAVRWLDRMEQDHANLRSAMDWLISIGDAGAALRLALGMRHFWRLHSHFAEGRMLVGRALALPHVLEAAPRYRNAAYATVGTMALNQGDLTAARTAWELHLELNQRHGSQRGISAALIHLASIELALGHPVAARELIDRSEVSYRAAGNDHENTLACSLYGRAALLEEDVVAARRHYEGGITLARSLGDLNTLVGLTMGLGEVALHEGNPVEARSLYEESLRTAAELGNRRAIAELFEQFAVIAAPEGRPREALGLIAAARTLREEIGASGTVSSAARLRDFLQAAQQALGAVASAAAWAEGSELTLEQAIAFALGHST